MVVVGIDEAGYGPLLGPLVAGASIWRVRDGVSTGDLWKTLRAAVHRDSGRKGEWRVQVDDSKKLFDQKKGIATLERSVLAFGSAAGLACDSVERFLESVICGDDPAAARRHWSQPWYRDLSRPLPADPVRSKFDTVGAKLSRTMDKSGVRCVGLAARVVTEGAFNARIEQTRNKASVIVEQVLHLLQHGIRLAAGEPMCFLVDQLGGRTNYRDILQTAFPERHLQELSIGEDVSAYRLTLARDGSLRRDDWTIEFRVGADGHHLPVALAGMLAKYCRELLMHEFNRFWLGVNASLGALPELRPTAGYYGDAQRFLRDISPLLAASGLRQAEFVRAR